MRLILRSALLIAGCALVEAAAGTAGQPAPPPGPVAYDPAGGLRLPGNYREWVFLTSGLDMSHSARTSDPAEHGFDNGFVPRDAYRAFQATGQ
jgi:hypothetical protein